MSLNCSSIIRNCFIQAPLTLEVLEIPKSEIPDDILTETNTESHSRLNPEVFQESSSITNHQPRSDSNQRSDMNLFYGEEFLQKDWNATSDLLSSADESIHSPTANRKTENDHKKTVKGQKEKLDLIANAMNEFKFLHKHFAVKEEDECDVMGKQIAFQLRDLPKFQRIHANLVILKVLSDFQLNNIESQSSSESCQSQIGVPTSNDSNSENKIKDVKANCDFSIWSIDFSKIKLNKD